MHTTITCALSLGIRRAALLSLLLLVGMASRAQSDCFKYEDSDETIIYELTPTGLSKTSLTIPATVTTVRKDAFSSASNLSTLVIEAGGNPAFEAKLFGDSKENPIADISVMGTSMTVANLTALFASLGAQGNLSSVYIAGYSGEWSDIAATDVLTSDVSVALPAALVSTQQFGDAKVYGRFELAKELVTFCGNATFLDQDAGSNMLFYVADECNKTEGYIHIQRVRYVAAGKGVLIHNATGTSTSADLPRVSDGSVTSAEQTLYGKNLFKGVIEPTVIGRTDGDKTNLVLSNGAFHPTSGGTIGANKAYLQVPTDVMAAHQMLTVSFDDETVSVKEEVKVNSEKFATAPVYDLQGRKLQGTPTQKGIYINNGKKYVIR